MSDALFSVENKICIVTGGLGQIGKNFVEELHNRGAKVAVFSRTVNQPRIESIFPKDKEGFIYCRSHFFKSCLFRGNIQQFFEDYLLP